jgi:hypothetical protein
MSGGEMKVSPRFQEESPKEHKPRRGSGAGKANPFVSDNGSPLGTRP